MNDEEFDRVVEEAIHSLPDEFRDRLENVAVMAEDEPDDELREELGLEEDEELFGLFVGESLVERSVDFSGGIPPAEPARVLIFRGPLERCCDSEAELVREIRETLIHELGHFFGLEDDDMEE